MVEGETQWRPIRNAPAARPQMKLRGPTCNQIGSSYASNIGLHQKVSYPYQEDYDGRETNSRTNNR